MPVENNRRTFYKSLEPYQEGNLKVSDIHELYYEISGNQQGLPVLILHGGPGSGSDALFRGIFDPEIYKIVQFDQRGSGKSIPFACLEQNTTWDLVDDCEKIRNHLNINKWHTVCGGSWGSTLALAYAQTYPNTISHLIIRGIFLLRKAEVDFFYQQGTSWFFPEYHEQFKSVLPNVQQGNILHNYYLKLTQNDNNINHIKNEEEEKEKLNYAKAMAVWEMATSRLLIDEDKIKQGKDERFAVAHSRLEAHYFINGGFFRNDNQLLEDCYKIEHIPTYIIQGRYDMVCPAKSAYDLHKALKSSQLIIIPDAGHAGKEPGIQHALVTITDQLKNNTI